MTFAHILSQFVGLGAGKCATNKNLSWFCYSAKGFFSRALSSPELGKRLKKCKLCTKELTIPFPELNIFLTRNTLAIAGALNLGLN